MGGWKDELRKIKARVGGKQNNASKHISKKEPQASTDAGISWKKNVKPIKHGADRVPPFDARNTGEKYKQTEKGKARTLPKSSRVRVKRIRIRVDDGLPSPAAIARAYGSAKSGSKKVTAPEGETEIHFPKFEDLPETTLTQASEFKEPDDWVQSGTALQAPGGGGGKILRVRLGIDFGTAYTKVALRVADKVFFVDWSGVRHSREKFLLPGEISRCADSSVWLGRHPKSVETVAGLKNPYLLHEQGKHAGESASVAFMAWVLRYARAWLYRYQLPLVQTRKLVWEVNIGSPTDPWSRSDVRDRYKQLVKSAWRLSQVSGNISIQAAEELSSIAFGEADTAGLDDLNVMPEFVAQVAGYVKSPQRKNGLHLLVDVGAGTVDVTAFNVFRPSDDEEDRFPIFAGVVKLLGTHILMAVRLAESGFRGRAWQDLEGIPSREQLSRDLGVEQQKLVRIDDEFSALVSQEVGGILSRTKMRRDPMADAWKEGLRIFLAGGGSVCDVYRTGVERAFTNIKTKPLFTPFPMLEEAGQHIGKNSFHRLSVAFGLTYDAKSIGKIVRPQEIEDISPFPIREQPDRDDLYAK